MENYGEYYSKNNLKMTKFRFVQNSVIIHNMNLKMSLVKGSLFPVIIFLLLSCSGEKKSNPGNTVSANSGTAIQSETLSKDLLAGQEIYKKYCLSCHQASGKGVSGMYPPLLGNPDLKLRSDSLIMTVLKGKAGRLLVNGNEYAGIMAPQNFLSDEQVSNVLNFVRNGMNKYNIQVKPEEVAAVRGK